MFTIKRIDLVAERYFHEDGATKQAIVHVEVDAKRWHEYKARRNLGQLYGVDISNAVYKADRRIHATNPTVSDRERAKGGIKRITLYYNTSVLICERKPALSLVK